MAKFYVGSSKMFESLLNSMKQNRIINIWGNWGVGKTKFIKEFLGRAKRLNIIENVYLHDAISLSSNMLYKIITQTIFNPQEIFEETVSDTQRSNAENLIIGEETNKFS